MSRLLAAVALGALAACDGGLKVGVDLPTKVQAGVAGSSDGETQLIQRVTDNEPYILIGADENDRTLAF
ncbi:hypothetical protein [Vannielia litorea]|uniref:Uncharacterized protein n=1 Tax=Vannielia litorea TaxID=1217970 RepID=A0A1N6DUU4_9RHOB|nr:hypothetical protein [Vannielia litorea]SIN74565.1 hypothetical protein SAMN05444002_0033 [Vannielia litorea]